MASNKIILRGAEYGGRQDEFRADAALKPGHFLTKNSDNEVLKQATAGADGPLLIAIEDRLKGGVITDAYAAGDLVTCWWLVSGMRVQARIADGVGPTAIGTAIKFANDGTVVAQGGTGTIKGWYDEVVTASGAEAFVAIIIK